MPLDSGENEFSDELPGRKTYRVGKSVEEVHGFKGIIYFR